MPIRLATSADLKAWAELRALLWPGTTLDQHMEEAAEMLAKPPGQFVAFLDVAETGHMRAFAEVALRHDYVQGCKTSPVAYLEGIFVRAQERGAGVGARLIHSVRAWARDQGCSELASDADLMNTASDAFHKAVGFEETARVICYRSRL